MSASRAQQLVLFLLISASAAAQVPEDPAPDVPEEEPQTVVPAADEAPRLDVDRTPSPPHVFTLDNGLEVALQRDPRWSTVGICITYRIGSGDDPVGYRGLAHLTEHMMFTGSPHAPEGFFAAIEPLGGRSINASTSLDRTKYCEEVPKEALARALYYEADRMGYLLASIDEEKLAIQKRVVMHEYHERGGDSAGSNVTLARVEALYAGSEHRYRRIYEYPDDIEAIELDDIRWFFQQYYTPANATLAIAGDFDVDAIRALVQRYFGVLRGRPAPPERDLSVEPLDRNRNLVVDTVFTHESVTYTWLTPAWHAPGDAELDVAADWLRRTIRDALDNPTYRSLGIGQHSMGSSGRFTIAVTAEEEIDAMTFESAITESLERLRREPLDASEFDDLKRRVLISQRIGRDRPLSRASHMANTGADGEVRSVEDNVARFERITAADLQQAVRRWLPADRRVRLHRNFFRHAQRQGNVRARESAR